MKDLVTIGLPSKGRLKESSLNFLEKNNLKLSSKGGDRDYFADFDNLANAKVIYLHAREIIERLGDGTLDVGISGLDLLGESSNSLQKKVETLKELDFGKANLVVAVPDDWIDVQTVADLEEVSFYFRDKKNSRLRIATKYPNLTNKFFATKGVTQYRLILSLGATETYPFIRIIRNYYRYHLNWKHFKSEQFKSFKRWIYLQILCMCHSFKKIFD